MTLADLDGTWLPRHAVFSGAEIPRADLPGLALEIQGGLYRVGPDHGRIALAGEGPPLQIDIIGEQGPNAGRILRAIARLEGNYYLLCYDIGTGPRPVEFASPRGSMRLCIEFQRSA